jgi:cation diffusion facilitator family transporter
MSKQRYVNGETVSRTGALSYLALSVIEGVVGWLTHSKALMTDAVHTFTAAARAAGLWYSLHNRKKSGGSIHSHERMKTESFIAVALAILMITFGIESGWKNVKAIYAGNPEAPHLYALIGAVAAILFKEAIMFYRLRNGFVRGTRALLKQVREYRSDMSASLAAFLGIGGALLGERFEISLLRYLDPAAGVYIGVLLVRLGIRQCKQATESILAPLRQEEETSDLIETIRRVRGVITVDELRAREIGHYVVVNASISVNPGITVSEGQEIARLVKHCLLKRHSHVADAIIYVSAYEPGYPYKTNYEPQQEDQPMLLQ